jgi:hypothetical protein
MRFSVCLALAGLVVMGFARGARAEGGDPVAAEALFRAGRAAADRGDYVSACAKFGESHRLDPAVGTLLNLGLCNEQLGKIATAWQLYREVAQRLPPGDERIAIASAHASALEAKLPYLTLELSGAPAGTTVLRDGVELGSASLGLPLPIDPGPHVVVVRSPGRAERRYDVSLEVAQRRQLAIEAGDALPGADQGAGTQPHADGDGSRRTIGIVLVGVGGASIVASLALGAVALSAKHTMDHECVDKRCSPAGLDAADRGETAALASTITFTAGVVSALVGGYLWLGAGSAAPRSGWVSPSFALGVTPLPNGALIAATGRLP